VTLRYVALVAVAGLVLFASGAGADEPVHRIGVLTNFRISEIWLEGLREHGWVDGGNLHIEYRYYRGQNEQLPALAAELAASRPEVIVAQASPAAAAIHAAAPTVPLVFLNVGDPIALGLVESLAHPGGHASGFATLSPEGFMGKTIQLLKELVPRASRIAQFINPSNPMIRRFLKDNAEIEQQLGVKLIVVEASTADQFEAAFASAVNQGAEAINVGSDPLTFVHSAEVVALAARYRLPAMYLERPYVLNGRLMCYGPRADDQWYGAASYVDKILRGEKPADLPVQQPTRYYLIINLKTAAALGITVPPSLLGLADEVIE
jgi:putative ABC transport system substrate-binding protein